MPVDVWPASLPQDLLLSGYSEAIGDGRLRSSMDTGPAKVRRRSSFIPWGVSGSIRLSTVQFSIFQNFVVETLLGGSLPFQIRDPLTFASSGRRAVVRLKEMPSWAAIRPDLIEVSLSLEKLHTVAPPAPTFDTAAMPAGREGVAYSWSPTVIEGTRPFQGFAITAGSLPPGMTLNATTGLISGTAPDFGTFNFTLRVTDADGRTASVARSLVVRPPAFIFAGEGSNRIILDPTFTRASGATYWGRDGVMRVAGTNVPRFDYDPVSGAFRGVLMEEQRTNLVSNSNMVGASVSSNSLPTGWGMGNYGGVTRQVVATGLENGLPYVDIRLFGTPTSSGNLNLTYVGAQPIVAGQFMVASQYIRLVEGVSPSVRMRHFMRDAANVQLSNINRTLDLTSGVLVREVHSTVAPPDTANNLFNLTFGMTAGQAIDVTYRIAAPQLEVADADFPTSFIPTNSAAATRAPDTLDVNSYTFAAEGTAFADVTVAPNGAVVAGGGSCVFRMGTAAQDVGFEHSNSGNLRWTSVNSSGGVSGVRKLAIAYDPSSVSVVTDGTTDVTSGQNAPFSATPTRLSIGSRIGTSSNFRRFCGHVRRFEYVTRKMPVSEMQDLTRL